MHLERLCARRPGQLSGGEQQRLAIARALVIDPQWLLLDEPLAHLDGPVRGELFDLLRQALRESGASVLMATHNADEALRVADEAAILVGGRIAQSGPAREVYHKPISLVAALVLGPAGELCGTAKEGALVCGDQRVLDGVDPSLSGPTRMIVRPEDLAFRPDPLGPAVVRLCEFMRGRHLLRVAVAERHVEVLHSKAASPGTRGRLRWRASDP